MKRIDILAKYGHLIKHYGTGKDSYYYFRIPEKTIKGGAFRRKKKTKEEIESALCDYFIEKEKQNFIGKDTVTFEIGRARVGKECRSRWSPYH